MTFYVSTEQVDTDFMVVLTDIFPNGDTQYLQRAFLRASLRRIAGPPSKSGQLNRSFDTAEPMVPGHVYKIEISMPPLGQVLRKGHRLEVAIMSPSTMPSPDWGLLPLSLPGRNTLHHSAVYLPTLDVPILPGVSAPTDAPRCGSLEYQPCRLAVPAVGPGPPYWLIPRVSN